MEKQKICIIGGSLTGLLTAISLSKLNCEIDLIIGGAPKNQKSNRTIAISESNMNYINSLNISKSLSKNIWPCSVMKLYSQNKNDKVSEVFHLDNNNKPKKIFYMIENFRIIKLMMDKIKKIKSISIINNELISDIYDSGLLKSIKIKNNYHKYNLIIICTGNNSNLVKNIFTKNTIENSYKEKSLTTIIKHDSIKNNITRQLFLNDGILALLPISNTKTSIVYSTKELPNANELNFKKKILYHVKSYLKNPILIAKIKSRDLSILIRNNYYKERILLFGDTLHTIHPFVGQGFNMTIRDLSSLENLLREKINLGLDIGTNDILSEFTQKTKPRNFIFTISVDLLKNMFTYDKFKSESLKILNKSNLAKNTFFNIADKGFQF